MVKALLFILIASAASAYEGGTLRPHNHTGPSDGGQMSNLSVLGTISSVSTATYGAGTSISTINVGGVLNYAVDASSGIRVLANTPIQLGDGNQLFSLPPSASGNNTWSGTNIFTSTIQASNIAFVDFGGAVVHRIDVDNTTMTITGVSSPVAISISSFSTVPEFTVARINWVGTAGTATSLNFDLDNWTSLTMTATCNKDGAAQSINYITTASSISISSVNCPWNGSAEISTVIQFAYNAGANPSIAGFLDSTYSDAAGGAQGAHVNFTGQISNYPKFLKLHWSGAGALGSVFAHVYHSER